MPTTPKFHFYTKFGGLLITSFVSCFKVITKKRIATLCSLITIFIIMIILLIRNLMSCFNFFEIEEWFCLFVCEFYNHIMVISPLQLVNHFFPSFAMGGLWIIIILFLPLLLCYRWIDCCYFFPSNLLLLWNEWVHSFFFPLVTFSYGICGQFLSFPPTSLTFWKGEPFVLVLLTNLPCRMNGQGDWKKEKKVLNFTN